MAARSADVTLINETDRSLNKIDESIDHGEWNNHPPDTIAPHSTVTWGSESAGFLTGTEGSVRYHIGGESDPVWLFWDVPWTNTNPFMRTNTYDETGPPVFVIEHTGGGGENAHVEWRIKSLPEIQTQAITQLDVRIVTSSDKLAGTDNDVYFDIGGLGWKLSKADYNDFEAGRDDTYPCPLPADMTLSPTDIVWLRLQKKGIFGVTGTPDGLDGAWKPELIELIVNGAERIGFTVNRWLDEDKPIWMRVLKPRYSLSEAFAHTLRMAPNNSVGWFSELIGGLTTYLFKDNGISGWENTPVPVTCATGKVYRTPAWSTDGLATIDLQLEGVRVGNDDFVLDGRHGVEQTRYLRIEALDWIYLAHTIGDKQRVKICGDVVLDSDQEMWYEIHPRDETDISRTAPTVLTTHSGALVQNTDGSHDNYEFVAPAPGGGFSHYWRNNDTTSSTAWTRSATVGQEIGQVDSVGMIQSNFGSPGNLEVVARVGDGLWYAWRDATGWHGPDPLVVDGAPLKGVRGTFAYIQSRFGWQGNFELVAPLAAGGLAHYTRDNDDPARPWHMEQTFGASLGQFDAVTMIESAFGTPGNLEVIARAGDHLVFCWYDTAWHGPDPLIADRTPVTGITGTPALIQSRAGALGNFELVAPLAFGGIARYWRNNDDPGRPWSSLPIFGSAAYGSIDAVSLIQTKPGTPEDFAVVAHIVYPSLSGGPPVGAAWEFFWRDPAPGFSWNGPTEIAPG